MAHPDDCDCDDCEAEAEELRALLLNAVRSGQVSEADLLTAIAKNTQRPEIVAMAEDRRLQIEAGE